MSEGRPRFRSRSTAIAAIASVALVVAACAASTAASPSESNAQPASTSPSPAPSEAVASPSLASSPSPTPKVTQTDTAWGRIWDAVPASFPLPAGAEPATPGYAASGAWSLPSGDPAAVTEGIKAGLEANGFTTAGMDGPLEDGSRIIDSVGKPDACRVQTRVKPLGTTISITVLFGAACSFR